MKRLFPIIQLILFFSYVCFAQEWEIQTSNTTSNLTDVYFVSSETGFAVGSSGTILKTVDGGKHWSTKPSGTSNSLLSVCFVDSLTGFTISSREVFKTIDGGENWFLQDTIQTNYLKDIQFVCKDTGYIFGFERLLKTTDGGINWLKQRSPNVGESFWANRTGELFISGPDFLIVRCIDGINWKLSKPFETYGAFYGMFFTDQNTGYAVGGGIGRGSYYHSIYKTTNAGASWTYNFSDKGDWLKSAYFIDDSIGYVTSFGGDILKTTNAGKNWIKSETGVKVLLSSINFPDSVTGYIVGNNGTILKTKLTTTNNSDFENLQTRIKCYPNPVTDFLIVENEYDSEVTRLSIYDLNGRSLINLAINEGKNQIDLSSLQKGIYIAKITGNDKIEAIRIFKQ